MTEVSRNGSIFSGHIKFYGGYNIQIGNIKAGGSVNIGRPFIAN